MQIHEITKASRTDEGILDTVKNVIKHPFDTTGFAAAQEKSGNAPQHQARADANIDKINADRASRGLDPLDPITKGRSLDQVIDQYKQSPAAKKKIKDIEADFENTFALVLPKEKTNFGDDFYMDADGNWFGKTTKQRVTNPNTIQTLNNYAQSGAGKAIDPNLVLPEPTQTTPPTVTQTAPTPPTAPAAPPPGMRTNPARAVKEAIRNATPGTFSKNAALRNAPTAPATQPATAPGQPHDLQKDFQGWAEQHVPGLDSAYTLPDAKQKLDAAFQQLVAAQKNPAQQKKAFENYMTIAYAAVAYAKNQPGAVKSNSVRGGNRNGRGVNPHTTQGYKLAKELDTDGADGLKSLAGQQIKKTGNPALDDLLYSAGLTLSESQTFITKDIHVKTSKGDYIKRASDQQWYDPNGILIDPVKYASYIEKLDNTSAAKTRYQADAIKGKGSDTAYTKSAQSNIKPEKLKLQSLDEPPKDPAAAMAKMQDLQYRMRNASVAQLNQRIEDTTQKLRMAEIVGTDQAKYLEQQLAMLIALKA